MKLSKSFFNKIKKYPEEVEYYQKLCIVESSEYSILKPWEKPDVSAFLSEQIKDPKTISKIIDATAHIGVDTLHLSDMFPNATIDAYEVVDSTYRSLQENIKTIGKEKRIHAHHKDITTIDTMADIDLLYVDPPWGGSDYKTSTNLQLYLQSENEPRDESKNIVILIHKWMDIGVKSIVLKIPYNFSTSDIQELEQNYTVHKGKISGLNSKKPAYYLLYITPK
jgi:hypothetical protein